MKEFKTEVLSPLDVDLDPHNPRLSAGKRGATQPELLKVLVDAFKVEDVAVSIATSGYLPFEALVGFRRGSKVVVREGNRRIAALKVLLKRISETKRETERQTSHQGLSSGTYRLTRRRDSLQPHKTLTALVNGELG